MESTQFINHFNAPGLAGSHLERMNDHASTLPAILRLPRELRDLIYEHYVQVDGGYCHNFETNRLLQADGSPISTALALTCRQIATEMRGLALGQNTITFSTHFSESTRQQAGVLNGAMHNIVYRKKVLLQKLIPRLLSYDIVQRATDAFPQFAHIFHGWTPHQDIAALYKQDFDCGEAPSTWDDFVGFVFNLLSKHSTFHDEAELTPGHWISEIPCSIPVLGETSPEPWLIPNPSELDRLAKIVDVEPRAPTLYSETLPGNQLLTLRMTEDFYRPPLGMSGEVALDTTTKDFQLRCGTCQPPGQVGPSAAIFMLANQTTWKLFSRCIEVGRPSNGQIIGGCTSRKASRLSIRYLRGMNSNGCV
ncbi:hypothetical protein J4E80_001035 [Alternaria sp. BMP 0032]|nr:hypothetical protein J4E80_001035 [Alternaria sp. BMP 0032]